MTNEITMRKMYKDELFILEREAKGIRMFWNGYNNRCIIVDKDDNILFAIGTDCNQNFADLIDLTEE